MEQAGEDTTGVGAQQPLSIVQRGLYRDISPFALLHTGFGSQRQSRKTNRAQEIRLLAGSHVEL